MFRRRTFGVLWGATLPSGSLFEVYPMLGLVEAKIEPLSQACLPIFIDFFVQRKVVENRSVV